MQNGKKNIAVRYGVSYDRKPVFHLFHCFHKTSFYNREVIDFIYVIFRIMPIELNNSKKPI